MKGIGTAIGTAAILAFCANAKEAHTQPFVPAISQFRPHEPMLANAVREADVIFIGVTTKIDVSGYRGIGDGFYSGVVTPQTFLKGSLKQPSVHLDWKPSATGISAGSKHIFFVVTDGGKFKVVKEIFVGRLPHQHTRTYWVYNGGYQSTLQSIKLLAAPLEPIEGYAASLLADLKQSRCQRQATAVMLACEVGRPECLNPLLYAITNRVEKFEHAVYGASRLDGRKGASAALALLDTHVQHQALVFEAISAAKNSESIPVLEDFGSENPEYRVSCAFAIRRIAPSRHQDVIRRWKADGRHADIKHTFYEVGWQVSSIRADLLLTKALNGEKVFETNISRQ